MTVKHIEKLEPSEYLRRYLEVAPLALAVFRAIEAKNISSVPMEKPILDVGCGFGEFAGVFFDSKVEMGLDISWKELISAKKANRYKNLTWADARELPFKKNYFNTVLSVSVLEHISGIEEVVKEVYRVLKPGGKFVITVNTDRVNEMLFWPKVLSKYHLPQWGSRYRAFYHRLFKHESLWNKKRWQKLLESNGFKVKIIREIISPEATKVFDLYILTAWPSQLIKLIFGKRWAWRPNWFREWLVRKYGWLVEQDEKKGSNLFIVAVKPKRKPG